MQEKKTKNRRDFLAKTLGIAGGLTAGAAGAAVAKVCGTKTAEQPLGPFYPNDGTPRMEVRESQDGPIALANDNDLTWVRKQNGKISGFAAGQIVTIKGILRDISCNPVKGAMIVVWQASSTGSYNHSGDQNNEKFRHPKTREIINRKLDPNFQYWGKTTTNEKGEYSFKTIVPGFYPANLDQGWYRPPHIHFLVSATGHPQFVTQSYFRGSILKDSEFIDELNKKDFLLQDSRISEKERQNLVVEFKETLNDHPVGIFNIDLSS
jgi:protocatechuate 3,4-dioxygenase beta subunit